MVNTNCLTDMQCPKCGSEGPFWIEGTADFLVSDDGTMEYSGVDWQSGNRCECVTCTYFAHVADFTIAKENEHETL
jgi:hypothetical protein